MGPPMGHLGTGPPADATAGSREPPMPRSQYERVHGGAGQQGKCDGAASGVAVVVETLLLGACTAIICDAVSQIPPQRDPN
jgi:hypothetical protein